MAAMDTAPAAAALGGSKETTMGVMGGGQLGRMFAHAAQQMGFFTAVLDPDTTSPAGRISHHGQVVQLPPSDLQACKYLCCKPRLRAVHSSSLEWLKPSITAETDDCFSTT